MFRSILHRMVFVELARVFALSLVGIMTILVMGGIIAEATQQGLKPAQVLAAIPLLIPSFLPYTIPATTLFATCVVYGRLAHDNEILAIKAAGINVMKMVWPGLFLGLLMSGITMGLYYRLIPLTQHLLRARILNDVEEFLYDMLRMDRCIRRPNIPYVMWVRQVQGTRLQDALFKRIDPKTGGYDIIANAREAELRVDMAHQKIQVLMRHGQVLKDDGLDRLSFESRTWEVPLPPDLTNEAKPKPRAMACDELVVRRQELTAEERALDARIDAERRLQSQGQRVPDLGHLLSQRHQREQEIYNVDAELHMRPALALGCLCFVMVGCPVGIWFSRSDYLSAFITCFLPVAFIYYPVLLCCTNQAKQGNGMPLIWVANGLMALTGLVLFRFLLKH